MNTHLSATYRPVVLLSKTENQEEYKTKQPLQPTGSNQHL